MSFEANNSSLIALAWRTKFGAAFPGAAIGACLGGMAMGYKGLLIIDDLVRKNDAATYVYETLGAKDVEVTDPSVEEQSMCQGQFTAVNIRMTVGEFKNFNQPACVAPPLQGEKTSWVYLPKHF